MSQQLHFQIEQLDADGQFFCDIIIIRVGLEQIKHGFVSDQKLGSKKICLILRFCGHIVYRHINMLCKIIMHQKMTQLVGANIFFHEAVEIVIDDNRLDILIGKAVALDFACKIIHHYKNIQTLAKCKRVTLIMFFDKGFHQLNNIIFRHNFFANATSLAAYPPQNIANSCDTPLFKLLVVYSTIGMAF